MTMKRFILSILVALPIMVMAQVKLGVVNSAEVFNIMPEKVAAEKLLQERSAKVKAENDLIQDEFNKKFADYQDIASDATTPETIKERRIQELQKLDNEIQAFQAKEKALLYAYRDELMNPILDKIQKAIEAIGEEEGMSIVFDTAKTPVAYTGPYTEDITPKVKARLGL